MCHFGWKEILLPVKYYVSVRCNMSASTKSKKWSKTRKTSTLTGRVVFLKKESNILFRINLENFLCQLEYRSLRIKLGDIPSYYVPQNNKKNEVKIIAVIFIAS